MTETGWCIEGSKFFVELAKSGADEGLPTIFRTIIIIIKDQNWSQLGTLHVRKTYGNGGAYCSAE